MKEIIKNKLSVCNFELPVNWRLIPLKDLMVGKKNAIKRGPFGSAIKKSFFVRKGYKVYEQKNAIYGNPNLGDYFITEEKFIELKDFEVKPGDFIVSCSGTIGRIARLPFNSQPGIINQALLKLTINEERINPKYFLYIFQSDNFQNLVLKESRGSAMKNLASVKDLKEILIPTPPLDLQNHIITEIEEQFSRLDEAVENLQRVKANLKRYKASVLKAAVEGKLTEQWRAEYPDVEPASQLLERILKERRKQWEENELAKMKAKGKVPKDDKWKKKYKEPKPLLENFALVELPKEWRWVTVDQIGTSGEQPVLTGPFGSNLGKSDFKPSGVPVITIGCLKEEGVSLDKAVYITGKKADELSRYSLKKGDLLFSRMAAVGRAGIVTKELSGSIFNYHIMRLRLSEEAILPDYYIAYVRGSKKVADYVREVNHGATRDGINTEQLMNMPVALPPFEEQKQIVVEIEGRLSVVMKIENELISALKRADRLRQSILKRAFSGQLVPQSNGEQVSSIPANPS